MTDESYVAIVVHWSDGETSTWPSGEMLARKRQEDGSYNYFSELKPTDPKVSAYLRKLGEMVVQSRKLDLQGGYHHIFAAQDVITRLRL